MEIQVATTTLDYELATPISGVRLTRGIAVAIFLLGAFRLLDFGEFFVRYRGATFVLNNAIGEFLIGGIGAALVMAAAAVWARKPVSRILLGWVVVTWVGIMLVNIIMIGMRHPDFYMLIHIGSSELEYMVVLVLLWWLVRIVIPPSHSTQN
ncbi:MAG TPA: hypothetical protein VFE58_11045 [Tepidisphaeraceae bacterium]|jgi:hypothetical protein|nr:hypothetical protein [Tepidisphaeraceae bacterium]